MLGEAKGEGVDAHAAGAFPVLAAGVVAGAVDLEEACGEVSYGVASEEQSLVPGGGADGFVEVEDDLCIGEAAVVEVPAGESGLGAHLGAPLAEEIVGGVVVFDEVVLPCHHLSYFFKDGGESFGDGGVVGEFVVAGIGRVEAAERQEQVGVGASGGLDGANPDTGTSTAGADLFAELGHAGEAIVALFSLGDGAVALPAVVDDGEGSWAGFGSQGDDEVGVAEDALRGVFAVCVVPVVGAEDGLLGEARVGADGLAEGGDGAGRMFAGVAAAGDDGGGVKFSLTEEDAGAAVAEVEPEGDADGVDLPEAEGGGSGVDSVGVGGGCVVIFRVVGGEVPGEDTLWYEGAPGKVAIAAFPCVAEAEEGWIDGCVPAEVDACDGSDGRGDEEAEGGGGGFGSELEAGGLPG